MRQADELTAKEEKAAAADYPAATHGPYCHAVIYTKHGIRYRFSCTREENHIGPHVAHVPGGQAAAVWTEAGS